MHLYKKRPLAQTGLEIDGKDVRSSRLGQHTSPSILASSLGNRAVVVGPARWASMLTVSSSLRIAMQRHIPSHHRHGQAGAGRAVTVGCATGHQPVIQRPFARLLQFGIDACEQPGPFLFVVERYLTTS